MDQTPTNERFLVWLAVFPRKTSKSRVENNNSKWTMSDLQELARKQIVLGGYRLGDFLRLVAQQGGEAQARRIDD